MELSSSNIKKFLIFSYILGNGTFQLKFEKILKIILGTLLILRENGGF